VAFVELKAAEVRAPECRHECVERYVARRSRCLHGGFIRDAELAWQFHDVLNPVRANVIV
jgi:hypothetical protein